ncbi:hypothetical protein scyTo_0012758 [Scyliorhinus torazame]|uniref:Uncharacterized protein n=1 Tax=Scyliorhinus torazame TaxID=75743 RepID=A0A401NI41_SCYTO|nr:hypothetical protein [Scyliorhinus torazame]
MKLPAISTGMFTAEWVKQTSDKQLQNPTCVGHLPWAKEREIGLFIKCGIVEGQRDFGLQVKVHQGFQLKSNHQIHQCEFSEPDQTAVVVDSPVTEKIRAEQRKKKIKESA